MSTDLKPPIHSNQRIKTRNRSPVARKKSPTSFSLSTTRKRLKKRSKCTTEAPMRNSFKWLRVKAYKFNKQTKRKKRMSRVMSKAQTWMLSLIEWTNRMIERALKSTRSKWNHIIRPKLILSKILSVRKFMRTKAKDKTWGKRKRKNKLMTKKEKVTTMNHSNQAVETQMLISIELASLQK